MINQLTLSALFLSGALSAQTFTTFTVADGLPSNDVRDLALAPDGTLWMATASGVANYDGVGFTVHTTASHPGLASDDVLTIAVTDDGTVWAGTDFGVSVLNGSDYVTYTSADGLGDDQVKNIKQAPNGDLWIGTINGATRYTGGTFTAFGSPDIPFGGVLNFAFAPNGDVWMSGGLFGIIVYDGSNFTTISTTQGLIANRIRAIAFDDADNKWVATAEGISVLDANDAHVTDHVQVFLLPPPDELNPITDIAVSESGLVWAGVYVDYLVTEGGVSVYDGTTWRQFETSDGLAGPNVRRVLIVGGEDVWVATSTGLSSISNVLNSTVEIEGDTDLSVFPVPATDRLEVRLARSDVAAMVEVLDAEARVVRTGLITGGAASLAVGDLEQGVYLVRIGARMQRIVVPH